jgi:type II secretory pathway component PulF
MNNQISYKALTSTGEEIHGTIQGTLTDLEQMAKNKNLIVIDFKKTEKKLNLKAFNNNDFLALVEELYHLSNAGISIDQALKMLIQTSSKEATRSILQSMLTEIKSGASLSASLESALKKEQVPVDALTISFIATAEEIGDIPSGLEQLFDYLTFHKKIQGDVKQALAYPIFLMIMSVVVALLIFFIIVPKFSSIFSPEEFEKLDSLPYAVLSLGQYLDAHMSEFFTLFAILIVGTIVLLKKFPIPWLSVFYRIPKLSDIIVSLQLSILYGALSTMLKGGLEIDKALKQFQRIKLLPELQDLLKNALSEIKKGEKLSSVFAISKIIPSTDIALLYVGENSATLPTIFKSLSTRHSEAFQADVKRFLSILEPAVIVLLGIFIAIIVVAIMMAVMSMTDIAG